MLEDERPRLDPDWQRQRMEIALIARAAAVAENIEVHQLLRGSRPHEQRARAVLCGQLAHLGWAPSTMERYLGMEQGTAAAALKQWHSQGFGLRVVPEEAYDPEYEAWLGRMKAERAKRKLRVVSNPLQRAPAAPRPPTPVRTWVDTGGNRNRLRSADPSAVPTLTATIRELAGGLR